MSFYSTFSACQATEMTVRKQEEGEYEYASYHHGSKPASGDKHVEPAVLVQSLNGEEAGNDERASTFGSQVPLCQGDGQGPALIWRGGRGYAQKA